MSYYYFRFYLADSEKSASLQNEETYQSIMQSSRGLGFIRASLDLITTEKNISILLKSEKDMMSLQNEWITWLTENNIILSGRFEQEILEEEERFEVHCEHDHACNHEHKHHEHKHHEHEHHEHKHHEHKHHEHEHHKHEHHKHEHHKHEHHEHEHHEHEHHEHEHHETEHHEHEHHEHEHHEHEHHEHKHDKHEHHEHDNHRLKAILGLVSGIALLVLSLTGAEIPAIAYYIITAFSTLMTIYLGYGVYQSAFKALLDKKCTMATLYTISTSTILVMSITSLFVPDLPMMLESAPLILGFWHLAEAIEHTLLDNIIAKLDVRDCAPQKVRLMNHHGKKISVNHVIPNDIITLKKGSVIPVDGLLMEPSLLYTTRINGSPYAVAFKTGDAVKAGMSLVDSGSALEMRATKTWQNSWLSLMAKSIHKANEEKAPVELLAHQILQYFVPGLLIISAISGGVIGFTISPLKAIECVQAILVCACPCALSLITPLAIRIGMQKAFEKGVQFKNGKTLQQTAGIDTVVFDLNGTLTKGEIAVKKMEINNPELLKYFAVLESQSNHPVAKVIKKYIHKNIEKPREVLEVTDLDTSHHAGIKGNIQGETFMIGNKNMLRANGINPIDFVKKGAIYMVHNSQIAGQILITDPLRKDAIATIKQLHAMDIETHICSGAAKDIVKKYAKKTDIPRKNVCANAVGIATLPEEISKESYIQNLQKQGRKVAMIGDAGNDLSAFKRADTSIAIQSTIGDTLTQQYADMTIQQGFLFPIISALDVANKTHRNILQNMGISLTYNGGITLVAAGAFLYWGLSVNPAAGVALMALESAIVLLNLYRLKHQEIITLDAIEEEVEHPLTCDYQPLIVSQSSSSDEDTVGRKKFGFFAEETSPVLNSVVVQIIPTI